MSFDTEATEENYERWIEHNYEWVIESFFTHNPEERVKFETWAYQESIQQPILDDDLEDYISDKYNDLALAYFKEKPQVYAFYQDYAWEKFLDSLRCEDEDAYDKWRDDQLV